MKINIENTLSILYKFYNKDVYDSFTDNNKYTKEQSLFITQTELFHNKYFSIWLNSMQNIAKKYYCVFWDTTHYNRQSFSGYFISNNNQIVFVMISSLLNIFYIENILNVEYICQDIFKEIARILPKYESVTKEDLNIDIKPYFKSFSSSEFIELTLHTAFFGYKPIL